MHINWRFPMNTALYPSSVSERSVIPSWLSPRSQTIWNRVQTSHINRSKTTEMLHERPKAHLKACKTGSVWDCRRASLNSSCGSGKDGWKSLCRKKQERKKQQKNQERKNERKKLIWRYVKSCLLEVSGESLWIPLMSVEKQEKAYLKEGKESKGEEVK